MKYVYLLQSISFLDQKYIGITSLGENITFESRIVFGAALVEKDRVLHLSAFKK